MGIPCVGVAPEATELSVTDEVLSPGFVSLVSLAIFFVRFASVFRLSFIDGLSNSSEDMFDLIQKSIDNDKRHKNQKEKKKQDKDRHQHGSECLFFLILNLPRIQLQADFRSSLAFFTTFG